jgi:hypothetical protein
MSCNANTARPAVGVWRISKKDDVGTPTGRDEDEGCADGAVEAEDGREPPLYTEEGAGVGVDEDVGVDIKVEGSGAAMVSRYLVSGSGMCVVSWNHKLS